MEQHLRLCLYTAPSELHPQKLMEKTGISYQHATPQSIGDQWWFWNCENVPDPLPKWLTPLNVDPLKAVGYGLSKEDADAIILGENADGDGRREPAPPRQ